MDIEKQLARFIDPRATNRARVEEQQTKLLQRLGASPNRLGGMIYNQALGQMPQTAEFGRKALGMTTPEERINTAAKNLQQTLPQTDLMNAIPGLLSAEYGPIAGQVFARNLNRENLADEYTQAQIDATSAKASYDNSRAGDATRTRIQEYNEAIYATNLVKDNPDYTNVPRDEKGNLNLTPEGIKNIIGAFDGTEAKDPITVMGADGEPHSVLMGTDGRFYDMQGNELKGEDIPDFVFSTGLQASELKNIGGLSDAVIQDFNQRRSNFETLLQVAAQAKQLLQTQPAAGTLVADAAAKLNELNINLGYLFNDMQMSETLDLEEVNRLASGRHSEIPGLSYSGTIFENERFRELGLNSGELDSMITQMAFLLAKSQQNGNSISNRDIADKKIELGANSQDPELMIRNMDRLVFTAATQYEGAFTRATQGEKPINMDNWQERYRTQYEKDAAESASKLK
tara:strand:- start:3010 stop:4383 length:1374 start_codon:yes stop_codon:yes gene_type:complete